MISWTLLKVALQSLLANKLRSFLAMLGIIIGVGAVVSMLAIGGGAQRQVMQRIDSMGTNLLIVRPGQQGNRGVASGATHALTLKDAETLFEKIPSIYQLAPVVSGNSQAKYMNKNTRANIMGTTMTYFSLRNFEVEKGRAFTEDEVESMKRVVVLGPTTAENLFAEQDPLKEKIKINGINFEVIGVLKAKGDQGWFNPDDQAIVPYTVAMQQLFGLDTLREIDLQAVEGANMEAIQMMATRILRQQHRLRDEEEDDFNIRNQAEILETASSVSQTFTVLLGSIASISLLVGGIGIMNIMLVIVTERTREIGVRKAIGAKNKDILRQFLAEAVMMSGFGGFLGIILGVSSALLIGQVTQFATVIQGSSILLAVSFSVSVGIFFGYYPASRAAKLQPVEALRYD